MLKLLPRAEQGVLMMSSSLPSPTVQPAHTITWPAPPECSLWTSREMRLDTDWMNAVRAERERGEEDRARWRPSHCRLGVITAHHTTVRGELRTLKSYLTSKWFHLLFPKVDVKRWSLSSLQFKVSDLRWESTVWKLNKFCWNYSKQVVLDIVPKLWCGPLAPGPNIILYFYWQSKPLITTESIHYTSHKVDLVSHPNPW